jgi:hypothetical protein
MVELRDAVRAAPMDPADALRIAATVAELDRRGRFEDALEAASDRLDPTICWIAETAHRIGVEGLEQGFVASALLAQGRLHDNIEEALTTQRVGPWLAPALDQHTRPGIRSIERFVLRCQQLATVLRVVPPRRWVGAVGALVFAAEGGLLSRRVVYPGSAECTRWDSEASLASAGAPIETLGEGVEIVRANLGQLDKVRAEVLPERWQNSEPR